MGESGNRRVCTEPGEEFEAPAPPDPLDDGLGPGVWREGTLLVMRKDEELPESCVKCGGAATGGRLRGRVWWHHPAYHLLWLLGPVGLVIYLIAVRGHAVPAVPVCRRHRRRRTLRLAVGWHLVVSGLVLFVSGCLERERLFLVAGLALVLLALVFGLLADRVLLRAKKMDDECVWLAGACPEYLARLPGHPPACTGL